MAENEGRQKLAAILAADVAGYSRLMGDDERATVATLNEYRAVFKENIESNHGRVVDMAGDSVLAVFESAIGAAKTAVDVQGELAKRNETLPEDRRMLFRVGINLGDVIEQGDGTVYGDGVNVAARLEAMANPGGVNVSGSVFDSVRSKLAAAFDYLGEHEVKNIVDPVRAYRVLAEGEMVEKRKRTHRVSAAAFTVAVVAVLGIVSFAGVMILSNSEPEDSILAMPTGPTIAVLPFTNMSGNPEQDYFSDGITEEIITELTRFRTLHVLARNSTFQYKGQAVDVRQVGQELGAKYVVEGSVKRSADTIRVTAQLLDAADGAHLWAEKFEREMTANNIFEVQDEITRQIVAVIGDTYGVISAAALEAPKARSTESLDAYQCVLSAHAYYASGVTPQKHLEVRSCLERAIEADQTYADAWAWLAAMYRDEYASKFNSRPAPLDRAEQAATRAIEIDPRNQEANLVLAHVLFFKGELEKAFIQAERAISLNPNSPDLLASLALTIASNGKWERGVALAKKAILLNETPPPWMHMTLLWDHYRKGDYEEALSVTQPPEIRP